MKDLLEKLSSYNIFNYLLPGIVFVALADALTSFHFVQQDIVIGVFVYYFIGLIISRLGSIVIEPILSKRSINPILSGSPNYEIMRYQAGLQVEIDPSTGAAVLYNHPRSWHREAFL